MKNLQWIIKIIQKRWLIIIASIVPGSNLDGILLKLGQRDEL